MRQRLLKSNRGECHDKLLYYDLSPDLVVDSTAMLSAEAIAIYEDYTNNTEYGYGFICLDCKPTLISIKSRGTAIGDGSNVFGTIYPASINLISATRTTLNYPILGRYTTPKMITAIIGFKSITPPRFGSSTTTAKPPLWQSFYCPCKLIVPKNCGSAYRAYFYSLNNQPSNLSIYEFDFNRWP